MPTTNISQIISDVIDSVRFLRIEQRRFVEGCSCALFLSAHKNTSRLAPFCSSSQSSISVDKLHPTMVLAQKSRPSE
ncbi:protein of unknown function [Mesotoga infera]|uniref:Uncharacterized protein n=1 Tax=Mesotoga infera TaxID=1236046 RepID=A0A7Z7PMT9_9BACT|nr:protein of unknown function [Mesotoga infera]